MVPQNFHDGRSSHGFPFFSQELFQLLSSVYGRIHGSIAGRIHREAISCPYHILSGEDFIFSAGITFKIHRLSFAAGQQHIGGYCPESLFLDGTSLIEGLGFPDFFSDDRTWHGCPGIIHMGTESGIDQGNPF